MIFIKRTSKNFLKNYYRVENIERRKLLVLNNIFGNFKSKIFQLKNLTGTVVENTYMSSGNKMSVLIITQFSKFKTSISNFLPVVIKM